MATCRCGAHDILPKLLPLYYNESFKKLLRDKIVYGGLYQVIILRITMHYRASSPDFIKG